MISKSRLAIAFGVATMVLGGAAAAWACTPNADIASVSPQKGPAGTAVTISGEAYSNGAVEIRWGSATGLELATVTGPNFTTTVTIPGANPGLYSLVAVDRQTGTPRSGFFQVTPAVAEEPPPPPPVDPPQEPPVETPPPVETSAPVETPEPTPAPPVVSPAPADAPSAPAPVVRPRAEADTGTRAATSPRASAPVPQAAATPAVAEEPAPSVEELSESALTVDGDLWSGFASGPESSGGASLLDSPAATSSSSPALAVGIALLAMGLVALLGGFAMAAVSRRRRARVELS